MSSYTSLASGYDSLTSDVDYCAFADFYEKCFSSMECMPIQLLDLCCGTGTLTRIMAKRGYEMIAVDASEDMLIQAREKDWSDCTPPLFICQDADELDLYGTVDAAYSSLDSINYIPPEALEEVFRRLALFIRPGGMLIFDIRDPEWLEGMDGFTSVDENEDLFCVWRADFDREDNCLVYGMDLFERQGTLWRREQEEHSEYAHSRDRLAEMMKHRGFSLVKAEPALGEGRTFFVALRV